MPINTGILISVFPHMDFKEGWNPKTVMRTICAFTNDFDNEGSGYIFISVEEKNGKLLRPVKGSNPYSFEAVVNSIHSIDERIKFDPEFEIFKANIKVKIIHSAQLSLDDSKSDITGFEIIDNGIRFNKNNYESFQTLDTEYKIEQGCRRVGRLSCTVSKNSHMR